MTSLFERVFDLRDLSTTALSEELAQLQLKSSRYQLTILNYLTKDVREEVYVVQLRCLMDKLPGETEAASNGRDVSGRQQTPSGQ